MKKWTKKLLVLAAAMAMCMLLGTLISAAENEAVDLPLDGKERLYQRQEEEPAIVGGDLSTNYVFSADGWDYYRIRVTGLAQLTISGRTTNNGSLGIKLCNKDGYYQNPAGVASDIRYTNSSKNQYLYYGVKSGYYYLLVRSSTSGYYLGAREDKKGDHAGTSKGSSANLNHNCIVPGVMPCNENWSSADWYTFYLSKNNKKIRIYLTTKGLGYIDATIYGPGIPSSGKKLHSYEMNFNDVTTLYMTRNGFGSYPMRTGRYYIKINRSSANYPRTSCAYWLRWNTY